MGEEEKIGLWYTIEIKKITFWKEEERREREYTGENNMKMRRKRITKNIFEVQHVNEGVDLRICKLRIATIFQMI